jgi:hypothetical protein
VGHALYHKPWHNTCKSFFEAFGFRRLRALLAEHADEEERSLRNFLMEELYSFVGTG